MTKHYRPKLGGQYLAKLLWPIVAGVDAIVDWRKYDVLSGDVPEKITDLVLFVLEGYC